MKRLFIDCGNTRIKWATTANINAVDARIHDGDPAAVLPGILESVGTVDSIVFVDVTARLEPGLPTGIPAERLVAAAAACGVTNAYPEPTHLGADRWAALLGAHAEAIGAACIIGVGTALTADLLAADGRHLGGWIAPGPRLAAAALASATRLPQIGAMAVAGPATDTGPAIAAGTWAATTGFVDRVRAAAAATLDSPVLVLTGGGAADLATAFTEARVIENLVLRGLAHWAVTR